MGRIMGFCDGCDCVDSNQWGVYCQVLGNDCVKDNHPDYLHIKEKQQEPPEEELER